MFIDSQKYPYLLGQRTYIKIESYLWILGQVSLLTFEGILQCLLRAPDKGHEDYGRRLAPLRSKPSAKLALSAIPERRLFQYPLALGLSRPRLVVGAIITHQFYVET